MPVITITIPRWTPAKLNTLMAIHWGAAGRLKALDRDMVAAYARMGRHKPATVKRRVSMAVVVDTKTGRLPDPDSFIKSAWDALVNAALLKDDSGRWCEMGLITVERGKVASTRFVLEDL